MIQHDNDVNRWIAMLADNKTATVAITMLADIGEPAIGPVLEALEHSTNQEMNENAQEVLVRIGRPVVEPLLELLQQDRATMSVIWTLGNLGDNRAIEPTIRVLNHKSEFVRWAAVLSLGNFCDRRAVEPLIDRLHDRASMVRTAAINALVKLGDPRALEPIRQLLNHRNLQIRNLAKEAVGALEKCQKP